MRPVAHTASWLSAIMILCLSPDIIGQNAYYVRVYFRDKGNSLSYEASDLLSARAIARRAESGIPAPDYRDFPVNRTYINSITALGYRLHSTSRWMNTALFGSSEAPAVNNILNLPFVSGVKVVKTPGIKSRFVNKLDFPTTSMGQSPYDRPITMLNGYTLHNSGFRGENVLIAVLDGGFTSADRIESLNNLRARNGIIATRDFVNNTTSVYNASTHGTSVMSILAGELAGYIAGTAPEADYILLKTEDVATEFPCEEDFWAAGAEFADSCGADIISSSLGYFEFDDPSMNYKHSDLDGNTAFVTRAADIAAAKGILVVNSAGNERDNEWKRIIFPSDGDSVAAIGAVNENRIISAFSSAGPAGDGRVKPDVSAMGVLVPLQTTPGFVSRASGTSFSCPVISGMAACLVQAVPEASNYDIIMALREGADRYSNPDTLYGYGIPSMDIVFAKLQDKYPGKTDDDLIIFPNPTKGAFELIFRTAPGSFTLEIFDITGKLVYKTDYPSPPGRAIMVDALQTREQGLYFVRVNTAGGSFTVKVIKIRE